MFNPKYLYTYPADRLDIPTYSDYMYCISNEGITKMSFTYTTEQAAEIVAKWNALAKAQLTPDQAHLVFHDNSDDDMETQGRTTIEVGRFDSKSGNPETFEVLSSEVEMDETGEEE